MKASEDYIALHTQAKVTNPASLSFVEQDARQSFMQGKSAMIPVWWWAYSSMINPEQSTLTADQVAFAGMPAYGEKAVTYAISMPFLGIQLFEEQGSIVGVSEMAVQP